MISVITIGVGIGVLCCIIVLIVLYLLYLKQNHLRNARINRVSPLLFRFDTMKKEGEGSINNTFDNIMPEAKQNMDL